MVPPALSAAKLTKKAGFNALTYTKLCKIAYVLAGCDIPNIISVH